MKVTLWVAFFVRISAKVFIYVMEFINPLIFNNEIKHERIGKATL